MKDNNNKQVLVQCTCAESFTIFCFLVDDKIELKDLASSFVITY
jgi:hypothetical protein